jgi:rod shape-determining protein MreD
VRPIVWFALALLLSALQSAALRWLGGGALPLALPLAIVVHLGLRAGNVDGAVAAAAVGYVVDLSTGSPKGLMTGLAVLLFLFSRLAGAAVDVQGRAGFAVLTAIGTFLYGVAALGFLGLVSPPEVTPGMALVGRVALEALLTGLASPFLLRIFRSVDALFQREEPGLLGSVNR